MFLTSLLSLVAPHECLGCGAEGRLICTTCSQNLEPAVERCYSCHMPTALAHTCLGCRETSEIEAAYAVTRYKGTAKDLLWKLKFGRARAAADEIGRMLARRLDGLDRSQLIVTYVPTATPRIRQRGYDQAELIARAVAHRLGLPCYRLLSRQHNLKQVGSSRKVRTTQLRDAFRPVHPKDIAGSRILLIDDVVTTGATLEAAAAVLHEAGARSVEAAVFAQA